ncbi:D-hexose-6-phosphate mutarotase [Chitiniphilus purpureus]|uniref:Putative glucose-6-phosphate 1-epimerase n=1 Tax=Chitiniphilus purpureus TaxID=2981137 RepID=A0ABY6DRS2_9NEIS|nr:D-hexose-6-phosphate mutarotase [Chitiniphilus sp. CD1]UXY17069.1 D-hexose-6-phosphate mutarotase [Chitiniphilus sp. CD1]
MQTLSAFDSRLADVAGVSIRSAGELYGSDGEGLPLVVIENALGSAVLALQGAHLVSFRPAGAEDLLWLSPKAVFTPGKAIRGGIPLCLPWFGGHPEGKPAHGFARAQPWTLDAVRTLPDGKTELDLSLTPNAAVSALWPHDFLFELRVTVGRELTLALTAHHRGDTPVPFSSAFHTYFSVPDVVLATIDGLQGTTYIDTVGGAHTRHTQLGALQVAGPTDRVYLDVPAVQSIATARGAIRIDSDTRSAVVWNPWEYANNVPDVGSDGYRRFVCVERGDVFDNALQLAPGERYHRSMTLSLA